MKIEFENYGNFYLTLFYADGGFIEFGLNDGGYDLKTCSDFIEHKMEQNLEIIEATLCDFMTGEIVATISRENEDFADDEPYFNEDMGFDPYLGCYTDDC